MASQPNYEAFLVEDKGEGVKAQWTKVAAIWNHRQGGGMDMVIPPGMSISGRIVIMPRKDREQSDRPDSAPRSTGRPAPRGPR